MNKQRIFSLQLLLCAAFGLHQTQAFVFDTLPGNATAMAIHKKTGTVVVGSTNAAVNSPIVYYIGPASGTDTETLTEVADSAGNGDRCLENTLAISENKNYNTTLAATPTTDPLSLVRAIYVSSADNTVINAINLDTSLPTTYDPNDAAGAANNGVIALTAGYDSGTTNDCVFAAVKVNGGAFFAANSGVRIATLNATTNAFTAGNFITIATNSDHIISTNANAAAAVAVTNAAALHWCPGLNRLYIGLQGTNNTGNAGNDVSFFALVIAQSDGTIVPLINNSTAVTFGTAATANTSNIVGLTRTDAAGTALAILKLDTMKTSTGHHYLIIQGGRLAAAAQGNKIFAIPLVDADGHIPGSLAQVYNSNGVANFKKTATASSQLLTENDSPAKVGNGLLPVGVSATAVTEMKAYGDAVYCSINVAPVNDTSQGGIYYSQAIFNPDGSINGWTTWAKAVPNEVSGASITAGACLTFRVDALTGKIWAIPNATPTLVRVTQWTKDTAAATLGGSVNALLDGACYSAFNLGQNIANFGNLNKQRYALFGGDSKVVIVKTATTNTAGYETVTGTGGIDVPTPDWTAAAATATDISTGLENVGPITALGWTNQDNGNNESYFLAGTNQGLYAYVSADGNDNGITLAAGLPGDTNAAPFDGTYVWKKLEAIGNDPVVKIVSMYGATIPVVFVLTHGAQHKLWRLEVATKQTLTTLNAAVDLVWTAEKIVGGNPALPTFFYDIAVTQVSGSQSGLVLATDKGLYVAPDVTVANYAVGSNIPFTRWALPSETTQISSMSTPQRSRANQSIYYSRNTTPLTLGGGTWGSVYSTLGLVDFSTAGTQPFVFAAGDRIAQDQTFLPLANPIKSFYTDGGRRFYIEQASDDDKNGCNLHVLPYYNGPSDYNVTVVYDLADPAIANANTFYWINEMGAGYLMAGTDDGVVVLR